MKQIETEKYKVREIYENDFEDVKSLLKENEYLGMLWSVPLLDEEHLDRLIRDLYVNRKDTYCVVCRETDVFCGYISILQSEREGELSVRMRASVDMYEVTEVFGKILKEVCPKGQKNLTIQYNFE